MGRGDVVRRAIRGPAPLLLAAGVLWAGAAMIVRGAPISGPPLAFWRCLLGAVVYQAVLRWRGVRIGRHDLWRAAPGGLGFGLSVVFLFAAYQSTTLVSASVIAALQPLALGAVAHRFSGRLGGRLWAATALATAGTVVVVAGSSTQSGTWSLRGDLLAACGIAANVLYVLGTKRARAHMGALHYQSAMLWVAAAAVLPVVLVTGPRSLPPAVAWWSIAGIVAVGGTGHVLFSAAQRHVSVAASSSILLVEVVATATGAAILFDQPPGAVQLLGMAVVGVAIATWVAHTGKEADADDERILPAPDLG